MNYYLLECFYCGLLLDLQMRFAKIKQIRIKSSSVVVNKLITSARADAHASVLKWSQKWLVISEHSVRPVLQVLGLKLPNMLGRAEKLTFQFSYGTKETSYGLSFFKPQPGHFERKYVHDTDPKPVCHTVRWEDLLLQFRFPYCQQRLINQISNNYTRYCLCSVSSEGLLS